MARIKELETFEVSLVPRAANLRKFLIFKSEGGIDSMNEMQEILKEILENTEIENAEKVEEVIKAMKLSEKAKNAVQGAMRLLSAYKDELPEDIYSKLSEVAGVKVTKQKDENKDENINNEGGTKIMPEEKIKKEDIANLQISEEMKSQLATLWKEKEDMALITKGLEEKIKKADDIRITKEYVEMVKTYGNITVNAEEFGKVLKEIADINPELSTKVIEVLKTADASLKTSSLFKEIGTTAQGESDAWGKIEAIAKELATSEKISKATAITKALDLNPDLYSAYLKESEGGSK